MWRHRFHSKLGIGFSGHDLIEVIKSDKKTIFGEVSSVGETAAKAAKGVKRAIGQHHRRGCCFLNGPGKESYGGASVLPAVGAGVVMIGATTVGPLLDMMAGLLPLIHGADWARSNTRG